MLHNTHECKWVRRGDFFEGLDLQGKEPRVTHRVVFQNTYEICTIAAISISRYADGLFVIRLEPAFYAEEEILRLCKSFFSNNCSEDYKKQDSPKHYVVNGMVGYYFEMDVDELEHETFDARNNANGIRIELKSLDLLKQFLVFLNDYYRRNEYPQELLEELINISQTEKERTRRHVIVSAPEESLHLQASDKINAINDISYNSPLSKLIYTSYLKKISLNKVKKLLSQGQDLNSISQLLNYAINNNNLMCGKLALLFGANPFQSSNGTFILNTSFNRIYKEKKPDVAGRKQLMEIMLYHGARKYPYNFTPLKSEFASLLPIQIMKSLPDLSRFQFVEEKNRFNILFNIPSGQVQGLFLATSTLSAHENDELFSVYKQFFRPSSVIEEVSKDNDVNLKHFFDLEFKGKEKFIEKILLNGQLKGINLYEIIQDTKHQDVIFFHLSCILMQKELRGQGFTNPLIFTLAFALQMLFPHKKIVCVYQAISFGSAYLVKDLHYFPKYTPFLSQFSESVIHHIQHKPSKVKDPLLVQTKPLESYSEIEVECVPEVKSQSVDAKDLDREFFEKMRGQLPTAAINNHRGVLILLLASDELWAQYADLCQKSNLDSFLYVTHFAKAFAQLVNQPLNQFTLRLPKHSSMLFSKHSNGRIETETVTKKEDAFLHLTASPGKTI